MRRKELQVIEIPKWGNYLRGKWREYFASHLSEEKQKTIGMDGFYGIYVVGKKLTIWQT